MILDPNLHNLLLIITTIKTKSKSFFIDILEIEEWLDKKKLMRKDLNKRKKYFMSVNKTYLAIILKLSNFKKIFKTLNKKYSTINVVL